MFEWLKERNVFKGEVEGEIVSFNLNTNKLTLETNQEINLFDSNIRQDFNWFENWKEIMHQDLISNGMSVIHVLSTESGDCWMTRVYRSEYNIPKHPYEDAVTIVNYFIMFLDELRGTSLTIEKNNDTCEKFGEWLEAQTEDIHELNNQDCIYRTLNAITFADCLVTDEETEMLYALHGERL